MADGPLSAFGLGVWTTDLTSILGEGSKGKDVVQVHARRYKYNQLEPHCLQSIVERNSGEHRSLTAAVLGDGLVVVSSCTAAHA